ncbi:MAG: DUF4956 domain-containing protein, partial [Bacteroidetes bacterium]|nr:DUF4956 domain-containing protein [Bacteroidota bacterium]
MNKIQTFEQFLATSSAQFSIWNYTVNILLTAALAYILNVLYNRYGNSLSNRKAFGRNFVVLAVTTMIIITIVKSSLALSLGLVGALSIVRFRAAIKEPEELTYLFLNIAIGLGFGADQKIATIIGFIFISLFLVGKNIFQRKTDHENHNLVITLSVQNPLEDQLNDIVEILKLYCTKVSLKRFDEDKTILETSFI